MESKTCCFFGIYDPNYARNRVLMTGLRNHGYTIIECRIDPRQHRGLTKYWKLFRAGRHMAHVKIDAVIVAFPGHTVVWLARLIFGKKIIFDAFLSLFDSNVYDRALYRAQTMMGMKDWLLDWYSCLLSSVVLVDTDEHVHFFAKHFFVSRRKLMTVRIGADPSIFYPRPTQKNQVFTVHFHGNFIPLQGLPYIIDAALLLKDQEIIFHIVGDGQEGIKIRQKISIHKLESQVRFIGRVPFEEVPSYIAVADACLGIFGDTEKAKRVIPNKVYEYLAMAKPVLSARTKALQELFVDGDTVLMSRSADARDLADKILFLKRNRNQAQTIAQNGYEFFRQQLNPAKIVVPLVTYLNQ
jgi:glycosyltransferase involved in cell wall biosynthesis